MRRRILLMTIAIAAALCWYIAFSDPEVGGSARAAAAIGDAKPLTSDALASHETRCADDRRRSASDANDAQPRRAATSPSLAADHLPSSLSGTDMDGDLRNVPSRQMIRAFDYFLSAEGEADPAALVRRAAEPRDVERVMRYYQRYVQYRFDVHEAIAREVATGDVRAALAVAKRMRAERFGAQDAEKMFGEDERQAEEAIARAELLASK
jgi:hypothetical protein